MVVITALLLFAAAAQAAVRRAPLPQASESSFLTGPDAAMRMRLSGPEPLYPVDQNTSSECTWWYDNDGDVPCEEMADWAFISSEEWHHWNPSVGPSCDNFPAGRSYCVAAFDDLPPAAPPTTTTRPPTTTTRPPTTTATPPPTTTTAGNDISTPQPIQPGMVDNCDDFHEIQSGDNCNIITQRYRISLAQFLTWNPMIGGAACNGLWLGAHVCVSVVGHTPPATTSRPSNGIETPQPIQDGMVGNCNRFRQVRGGDTCAVIAGEFRITVQQFLTWNPAVGPACNMLFIGNHVCVGTIGFQPPPTTTTRPPTTTTTTRPGNNISTPQPTQTGMVSNCNRFHLVKQGDTCANIGARAGILARRIFDWNSSVKSDCTGLWADVYVCTQTIGFVPPTSVSCHTASDHKTWGDNKPAALTAVKNWCDGNSSGDGSGGFATAQIKRGCFNAPFGTNRIEFVARNDFGSGARLAVPLCEEIMNASVNRCGRGGTGNHEGWWFSSRVVAGRC